MRATKKKKKYQGSPSAATDKSTTPTTTGRAHATTEQPRTTMTNEQIGDSQETIWQNPVQDIAWQTVSRRTTRKQLRSFDGTTTKEMAMVKQAILTIGINSNHKFRSPSASKNKAEMAIKCAQDTSVSLAELRQALLHIADGNHVQQSSDNPSLLRYSQEFLQLYEEHTNKEVGEKNKGDRKDW